MNWESQMRREELSEREILYRKFKSSSVRFEQLVQLIKRLIDDRYRDELLQYRRRLGLTELCEILVKSIYLCEIEEIIEYHKHDDEYRKELLNDKQLIEKLLQKEGLSRSLLAYAAFLIEHRDEYELSQMHRRSDYRDYQDMLLDWMRHVNSQLLSERGFHTVYLYREFGMAPLLEDREQIKLIIEIEVDKRYHLDADGHEFREIPFNENLISHSK